MAKQDINPFPIDPEAIVAQEDIDPELLTEAALPSELLPEPIDPELEDEEVRERAVKRLMGLYQEYKDYRESYVEPVWDQTYESYHGIPPLDTSPYGSCVAI